MQSIKNKYIYSEQYKYWNKKTDNKWIKYDVCINYKFKYITDVLFSNLNINKSDFILDVMKFLDNVMEDFIARAPETMNNAK